MLEGLDTSGRHVLPVFITIDPVRARARVMVKGYPLTLTLTLARMLTLTLTLTLILTLTLTLTLILTLTLTLTLTLYLTLTLTLTLYLTPTLALTLALPDLTPQARDTPARLKSYFGKSDFHKRSVAPAPP